MANFDNDKVSGESLHQLHGFCIANPASKVVYVTNQLQGMHGVANSDAFNLIKLQVVTFAVISKMCLQPCDTCNVCGAAFYPLPFPHFFGNMFTANCDYVNHLLPPQTFEKEMNDLGDDTMMMNLWDKLTLSLFPFTPQTLGVEQYSVEHWIGAHP